MDILLAIAAISLAVMLTVFVSLRKSGAPGIFFFSLGCFFALLSFAGVPLAKILPEGAGATVTTAMTSVSGLMVFSGILAFLGRPAPRTPVLAAFAAIFLLAAALLEGFETRLAVAEIGAAVAGCLFAAIGATIFVCWPRYSALAPYLLLCIVLTVIAALLNGACLFAVGNSVWAVSLLGLPLVFLGLVMMLHGWMIDALRKLVDHDDLTGVYSRRTFLLRAETLYALTVPYGRPLAFLLLDIDRFKQINDLYGHGGGDRALSHFTRVVETCLAGRGIIGRLGGEEFGVAVRIGGRIEVAELAESICREVRYNPAILDNGTPVALTVSIGITLAEPNRSLKEMMIEADIALYEAKATGRDRYCMADSFPGPASASARALAGVAAQLRQAAGSPPSPRSRAETG